jgi:hypothetical protein
MRLAFLAAAVFALLCATGCSSGLNAVVSGVEQRYSVHADRHFMAMEFTSICSRLATHDGVKGLRVAEFNHIGKLDTGSLDFLMQSKLGAGWKPVVKERRQDKLSVIFVRPDGDSMRMIFAGYKHGKLDVFRMEMNGPTFAKWIRNQGTNSQRFSTVGN